MDTANYVPCGPRLSQGDLVETPIGSLLTAEDLRDPTLIDRHLPPGQSYDERGLATTVPKFTVANRQVILRAFLTLGVVISPDCDIDKGDVHVLVAPVLPIEALSRQDRDGLRAGTFAAAIDLPGDPSLTTQNGGSLALAPSFVDFNRTTPVSPRLIHRLVALSSDQTARLQARWVRFVALRDISTTGTIAATVGKTVTKTLTVQTGKRRHTVMLFFNDGSSIVVYQEPKRKGPHIVTVQVREGNFTPRQVQLLTGSDVLLRFESEDRRDWHVTCDALGVKSHRLAASETTDVFVQCPDDATHVTLLNDQRKGASMALAVVDAPE